jgi:hypothetical protein
MFAPLFNYLGVRLNGPEAAGKSITLNFGLTDTGEQAVLDDERIAEPFARSRFYCLLLMHNFSLP